MRPNGNDQGFLASYFEFVDCNFIKEPRPNVAKGHERVFLRTLLSNFPSICSRQRIADSIVGFFYPHAFLNFTRIDLGLGSGRAHSKGRHNGCKCGVEFQSNHFPKRACYSSHSDTLGLFWFGQGIGLLAGPHNVVLIDAGDSREISCRRNMLSFFGIERVVDRALGCGHRRIPGVR